MANAQQVIQVLEIVLLIVCVAVGARAFFVLGDVRKTLSGIESTRAEISGSLKRVESVADATEHVLREELAPTLKAARETLANLEVTTRTAAETVQAARRLVGSVEGVQKLFTSSGPIAQFVMKKAGGIASGLFSGFSAGLKSVLGARHKHNSNEIPPQHVGEVAIPGTATTNPVLKAEPQHNSPTSAQRKKK